MESEGETSSETAAPTPIRVPGGAAPEQGYETPAARLLGRELARGWVVKARLARSPGATGGLYSVGYLVEHEDGREAFLKAHDYARAIQQNISEFTTVMADMLGAYNFEKELNDHCTGARMSRVVRVLEADAVLLDGSDVPVSYLIFELAEGDVRHHLGDFEDEDTAWKLRTTHQVATGLSQLHRSGVFHQDLKPSNVMDFGNEGSKIGDLGNGWHKGQTSPLAQDGYAGDPVYSPPECLFGFEMPEVEARLKARDLYMFGSLVLFLFTGVDATSALLTKLPMAHHPGATSASFEEALPHLIEATECVAEELEEILGEGPLAEIAERYRELCNPDPRRRGDPMAIGRYADPYGLERYISYFDLAANLAEGKPESST